MRDSEGRVVEDKKICKKLNDKHQSAFILEDTVTQTLMRWDEEDDFESTEIVQRLK